MGPWEKLGGGWGGGLCSHAKAGLGAGLWGGAGGQRQDPCQLLWGKRSAPAQARRSGRPHRGDPCPTATPWLHPGWSWRAPWTRRCASIAASTLRSTRTSTSSRHGCGLVILGWGAWAGGPPEVLLPGAGGINPVLIPWGWPVGGWCWQGQSWGPIPQFGCWGLLWDQPCGAGQGHG